MFKYILYQSQKLVIFFRFPAITTLTSAQFVKRTKKLAESFLASVLPIVSKILFEFVR